MRPGFRDISDIDIIKLNSLLGFIFEELTSPEFFPFKFGTITGFDSFLGGLGVVVKYKSISDDFSLIIFSKLGGNYISELSEMVMEVSMGAGLVDFFNEDIILGEISEIIWLSVVPGDTDGLLAKF